MWLPFVLSSRIVNIMKKELVNNGLFLMPTITIIGDIFSSVCVVCTCAVYYCICLVYAVMHCTECYHCCSKPEPPSAPRNVSVLSVTNTSAVLSWLPPEDDGGRNSSEIFYTINADGTNVDLLVACTFCHSSKAYSFAFVSVLFVPIQQTVFQMQYSNIFKYLLSFWVHHFSFSPGVGGIYLLFEGHH